MKQKNNKTNIKKMLNYTVKKVLWLINYSLSFSEKDTSKQISIKLLGCFVVLNCISIILFTLFSFLEIILSNPLFSLGLLIIIGVFNFKKEIIQYFKSKKKK